MTAKTTATLVLAVSHLAVVWPMRRRRSRPRDSASAKQPLKPSPDTGTLQDPSVCRVQA